MRLLRYLVPQVANLASNNMAVDELQVIEFIRRTTMVRGFICMYMMYN
jgi:hypothetical protein